MRKQRWTNWDYRFPRWCIRDRFITGTAGVSPADLPERRFKLGHLTFEKRSGRDARGPSEELEWFKRKSEVLEVIN